MNKLLRRLAWAGTPLMLSISVAATQASDPVPDGVVPMGSGSYTTQKPGHRWGPSTAEGYDQTVPPGEPWGIYTPRQEQSPSVTQAFRDSGLPTPTHTFWASAIWEFAVTNLIRTENGGVTETNTDSVPYSHWMTNSPFTMKFTNRGVNLTYAQTPLLVPYRYGDPNSDKRVLPNTESPMFTAYTYPARIDPALDPLGGTELNLRFEGLDADETLVDTYSDFSGTIFLNNPGSPETHDFVKVTLVNGSPFLHFEKNGLGDVTLTYFNGMRIIHESDGTLALYLADTRTGYSIFAPPGTEFDYVLANQDLQELEPRGQITVSLPGGAEHFSVAILPNELNDLFVAPNQYNEGGYWVEEGDSVNDLPTHIEGTQQPLVVARLLGDFFREDDGSGIAAIDDLIMDFRRHAFARPVNTQFDFDYDEAQAQVNSHFSIATELSSNESGLYNRSLMGLHRHHYINMDNVDYRYTYASPRGTIKVISANSFSTRIDHIGLLPNLPNLLVGDELDRLMTYLEEDQHGQWPDGLTQIDVLDTYYNGKEMNWILQIMHIAHQVGRDDIFDVLMAELRSHVEDWLSADDWHLDAPYDNEHCNPMPEPSRSECYRLLRLEHERKYFYYDEEWNAMIGYPASFGSDTELNDHHFHSGYIISAAAAIARYDSEWAQDWKPMVDLLIKDAANWEREDSRFQYLRYFDIYNGYSLANGHLNMDAGGNQESSSESINFAQAVAFWGAETGDENIRDLGIFLYASEMQAIHQYWFDVDGEVFPRDVFWDNGGQFVRKDFDRASVGMVWHSKADYGTWFSAAPRMIAGINFLPITGASLHLGHMDYRGPNGEQSHAITRVMERLDEETSFFAQELWHPPLAPEHTEHDFRRKTHFWDDLMWAANALVDADAAAASFDAAGRYLREFDSELSPKYPDAEIRGEAGKSRTHTYHWIYNLRALGRPVSGITANTAHYAVFERNGTRTHVAYNPGSEPITVVFSDGMAIEVGPGELSGGVEVDLAPAVDNLQATTTTSQASLQWQALGGDWSGATYLVSVFDAHGDLVEEILTADASLVVTDLQSGSEYQVRVQSVYGEQPGRTITLTFVTEVDLNDIPAVAQLRVTESGPDSVALAWEPLPGIYGGVSYSLLLSDDSGAVVEEYEGLGSASITLGSLTPGTAYHVEVVAQVGEYLSAPANLSFTTEDSCDAEAIYCVEDFSDSVEITLNRQVQWADIRVTSSVLNGGFRMLQHPDGRAYFVVDGLSTGVELKFEFTYFTNYATEAGPFTYTFEGGPLPPEEPPEKPPEEPNCHELDALSFCGESEGNGDLRITVSGAHGWAIVHHASGGFHMMDEGGGVFSRVFTGLASGDQVSVWFTVNRQNGAMDTDWYTFTYDENTQPPLPGVTGLTVTAVGDDSASFEWQPPVELAEEAGLSYRVFLLRGGDVEQASSVSAPAISVDGLTAGTSYTLQVEAVLAGESSVPALREFVTTGEPPAPECGEPGDVCATAIDGGLRITVYGAQGWATIHYPAGNFHMTNGGDGVFHHDITGLSSGQSVSVWLTVNTAQGAYNTETKTFTR